ncbi:hypothetical protein, partial [Bacillus thuringiensis]|uniref:hypothetical protein n=1 Tax=Bacillus thuringiensis TaxID=1428 RepID=UPI001C92F7BE
HIQHLNPYNPVKLSQQQQPIFTTHKKPQPIFLLPKNPLHLKLHYTPHQLKIIHSQLYNQFYLN